MYMELMLVAGSQSQLQCSYNVPATLMQCHMPEQTIVIFFTTDPTTLSGEEQ